VKHWAVALGLLGSAFAGDANTKALAAKVDAHYNALQTLKAHFVETYTGPGVQREESGTLFLKKPGKMRWDYAQPTEKVFTSDGKTAYFYVPGERQARKAPVKKLDDLRSPLRYLLGKTKLDKEFDNLQAGGDKADVAGDVVLKGQPRYMQDRISEVELEVSPQGVIHGIRIVETDGSVTQFRFSDEVENTSLADSQFKLVPPAGVEVIEGAEVGEQ
jgi:outer membrane lipoprotein carrier protein